MPAIHAASLHKVKLVRFVMIFTVISTAPEPAKILASGLFFGYGNQRIAEAVSQGLRDARVDAQPVLLDARRDHGALAVEQRQPLAVVERQIEIGFNDRIGDQRFVNAPAEALHPFPGERGDGDLAGPEGGAHHSLAVEQVHLVPHFQARAGGQTERFQKAFNRGVLPGVPRVSGVRDLEQKVGGFQFFERGLKRRHQVRGQLPDETHGVGEKRGAAGFEGELTDGGVEGRENFRRSRDVREH